jgi:hypothetical protein
MMAQLDIAPPRHDRRTSLVESTEALNLVAVASEPARTRRDGGENQPAASRSFRLRVSGTESRCVRYTRIAAHTVGGSAAWLLQRTGKPVVRNRLAGAIAVVPGGVSELPHNLSGILGLVRREVNGSHDHETIAGAIVALRGADALIVGPLGTDDAGAPGLPRTWRSWPAAPIARSARRQN